MCARNVGNNTAARLSASLLGIIDANRFGTNVGSNKQEYKPVWGAGARADMLRGVWDNANSECPPFHCKHVCNIPDGNFIILNGQFPFQHKSVVLWYYEGKY